MADTAPNPFGPGLATAIPLAAQAVAACRYGFGFQTIFFLGSVGVIANRYGHSIKGSGLSEIGFSFVDRTSGSHVSQIPIDGLLFEEAMRLMREGGYRQVLVLLAGLIATARRKKLGLAAAYRVDGDVDFDAAKSIVKHLACSASDEQALLWAAEDKTRWFVRQNWGTIADLAETLVKREKIEFDDAPASVLAIERIEGNLAPLSPPDALRVHECARIVAETGGKICETARRMGVCERTVGRYLSLALRQRLGQ